MIGRFIVWVLLVIGLLVGLREATRSEKPNKREPDENGGAGAGA